jgi:16S rRNA (adenine1518-N6/adenine1519-N6)-dimethyltransferase
MNYAKKSLGQNFLIDKNIIKKIVKLVNLKNKNVVEIGPGKGALTDEILKKNPKSLIIIEKDDFLANKLKEKYRNVKNLIIYNSDILNFDLEKKISNNSEVFGNLPYNISSQILIKLLKFKKWPPKFNSLIFMFQKELGEKITCSFPSKNYGRLSIISKFRLKSSKRFIVSPNCFFPKPKVTSLIIHFKPLIEDRFKIKKIKNIEKITNVLFSNKRKMINKNLKKLLSNTALKKMPEINYNARPSELKPETYFKIAELYEKEN